MNFTKIATMSVVALGIIAAQSASATSYRWTWDGVTGPYNPAGGDVKSATATYDNVSQDFMFETRIGNAPGTHKKPNGFWMAMSDGPNPKGVAGELAIFYFDATGSQPVLTAYGYNGANGNNSFRDGNGLVAGNQTPDKIATSKVNPASWINNLRVSNNADGTRTFKMDIKGSVINSYTPRNGNPADWKGVKFENNFGIWFHPTLDSCFTYGHDGYLTNYTFGRQGWLDLENQEAVPEPASMTALALGLAAIARRKRARSK